MEDLTGQVIKTYELKERIGEGGFGAVYLAHQQLIGREVAIKIILPHHANQPEFVRRFETEAQLVARLEHPHIVPLYDYWREPNGAYLVMRYLRGGSVQTSLNESGPWSAVATSHLLNQICEALVVAHRQNVIHRDLKPENILMDEHGNAYLSDFGIAKDLGNTQKITDNNAIVGSPAYLSPEQIRGEVLTPQADIYSLGVLVYEMLTGSGPFDDASAATLMYKHLSEPLPDLQLGDQGFPSALNSVLQRATAKDPVDRYDNAIEFAREFRLAIKSEMDVSESLSPSGTAFVRTSTGSIVAPEPENPYKGLRAFQQADAEDFFGREVLIFSILRRMQEPANNANFLAVVGPSGSGKSSVVKAGVIPEVRRNALPGSESWFIVEMLPGIDPMEEMEAALLRIAINPPESLLDQLNADERGLVRAVKRVLPDDETELLIMIDQFEELFTLVDDESTRRHFIDNLLTAISDPRSRIRVLITLRADFYDRPLQYNSLGQVIRQRTEVVLPLSAEELERAITGPAKRAGLHLEDGLVTAIVADVNEQPGALPLLQYALTELFERRDGSMLTLEAYNEIGGTLGALARRADELYEGLGETGQEAARQMFLRLVTLGEGTEDTRRRTLQSELLSIGDDPEEMEMVIDAFGRYRLLTFDHDPITRTATVEVAHEALIGQWDRLRRWLDESRDDLRTQQRLAALAEEWKQSGKENSYLARGMRLQQFESWWESTNLALNEQEAAYLHASIQARREREAEEQRRREYEERLQKSRRNILFALLIFMTVAAVAGIGLALYAFDQQEAAVEARQQAELSEQEAKSLALAANARNALIRNEKTLALSLALEARKAFSPTPTEVIRILATAAYSPGVRAYYNNYDESVLSASLTSNGRYAASAGMGGLVRILDNETDEQVQQFTLPDAIITSIVYTPDDARLLAGGTEGDVYLLDAETGEMLRTFEGHSDTITSLTITDDGTRALSTSIDHTMRLWDMETGEVIQVFEGPGSVIFDAAFGPNASFIATSHGDGTLSADAVPEDEQDRRVRLWNVETGEITQSWQPDSGWMRTVDVSSDGQYVAAGTWDSDQGGTLYLWDTESGELVRNMYGHADLVYGLSFTPDSQRLISVSLDRSMRVWDVDTGIEMDRFDVFTDTPYAIQLNDNGAYAVVPIGNIGNNEITPENETATSPGLVVMDLKNRAQLRTFANSEEGGHQEWAWSVDIHPDTEYAVSGSGPLFPPEVPDNIGSLPEDEAAQYRFESDVLVWDVATGEPLLRLEDHSSTVEAVNFNNDGSRLITGSWDGTVKLRSFAVDEDGMPTVEVLQTFTYPANDGETVRVKNARFSPDETLLAASGNDGTVVIWELESGEVIRQIDAHEGPAAGLAFHPDGGQILTGSYDNTAALWDVESGERVTSFEGHTARINSVDIGPDGAQVITGSWDNTVRLWDATTGEEMRKFVGHSNNIQTVTISADGETALSGGADTTIRMWSLDEGQEMFEFDNHTDWVSQVVFLPNDNMAISSGQDKTIRLWQLPRNAEEIVTWMQAERYVRDLTCAERAQYRVEPLCDAEEDT